MVEDSNSTYKITLVPTGVSPDEAVETRVYTFLPNEDTDDLVNDALTHIREEEDLDEWALRTQWEISTITRLDEEHEACDDASSPPAPAVRLHNALRSCSYTSAALARSYTSITITLKHPRTGKWRPTTLAIRPQAKQQFFDMRRDLTKQHAVMTNASTREVHEAMVRTAADVKPTLAAEFDNDPLAAQSEFIQLVLAHPNKLVQNVRDITASP